MAGGEDKPPQQQLDTRALEIAAASLGRVEALERRMDDREARSDADRAKLREEMGKGFDKLAENVQQMGNVVHSRITKLNQDRFNLVVTIAAAVIALLLGVIAWLINKSPPWPPNGI